MRIIKMIPLSVLLLSICHSGSATSLRGKVLSTKTTRVCGVVVSACKMQGIYGYDFEIAGHAVSITGSAEICSTINEIDRQQTCVCVGVQKYTVDMGSFGESSQERVIWSPEYASSLYACKGTHP